MKKLGLVMIFFGACIIIAGAAFFFIARLNAYEEYFLKSRLTAILEGRGNIVLWEKGKYEDLPLMVREVFKLKDDAPKIKRDNEEPSRKIEGTFLAHFIEIERGVVLFYERLSNFNAYMEHEGFLHIHNGGNFQVFAFTRLGNFKTDLPYIKTILSDEEIKDIGKWQGEVARKGFLYGGSGAATVILGIIALALPFFRTRKIPPVIIAEEHTVVEVIAPRQKDALVSEIFSETKKAVERKENIPLLIKEVESMIARSEGDVRAALENILAELPKTRGRIKKSRYLIEKAREIFLLLRETPSIKEAEEKVSLPPSPQEERSIEEILAIEEFIPEKFNSQFVKSLLLWGFLRPTESQKFFGEHYRPYEHIRRNTVGKGVPPEEFEDSFE